MRKKIVHILFVAVACLLVGCKDTQVSHAEEKDSMINRFRLQVKDEGCFYIDGNSELMMFYDYKLDKKIPICDQPNCKHNTEFCKAYLKSGYVSAMGCYKNQLYFFDVEDPEYPFYRADKNGSNRKMIARLNEKQKYAFVEVEGPFYFKEDRLIFSMYYMENNEDAAADVMGEEEYFQEYWQIVSLDLNSGELALVKEPESGQRGQEDFMFLDYKGNRMIYEVVKDDLRSCYEYDTENKTSRLVFEDAFCADPTKSGIGHEYVGMVAGTDLLCYTLQDEEKGQVVMRDMQTSEETCILEEKTNGRMVRAHLVEEELYLSFWKEYGVATEGDVYACYHVGQNKLTKITMEEYLYAPKYIAGEWYIMVTEDGWTCISKKDYDKKQWEKRQVLGSF